MKSFPPAGPVFDVGGGNGFVSLALQKEGWDVVVVEPGLSGAKNARSRGLEHVVCATLEDAEFKRHSLPAIGLFDVVEHVEDHHQFLRTAHDLLIPGGRLYLSVPAHRLLWSADDDAAGHFRRYTIDSLASSLGHAGFELELASYFFSLLPIPILLSRTIPSLLGINLTAEERNSASDHRVSSGPIKTILNWSFEWELNRLAQKRHVPFGASCVAVAKTGRPLRPR